MGRLGENWTGGLHLCGGNCKIPSVFRAKSWPNLSVRCLSWYVLMILAVSSIAHSAHCNTLPVSAKRRHWNMLWLYEKTVVIPKKQSTAWLFAVGLPECSFFIETLPKDSWSISRPQRLMSRSRPRLHTARHRQRHGFEGGGTISRAQQVNFWIPSFSYLRGMIQNIAHLSLL